MRDRNVLTVRCGFLFVVFLSISSFAGCSGVQYITTSRLHTETDEISTAEFTRRYSGRSFTLILNDSTLEHVRFDALRGDTLFVETVQTLQQKAIPINEVLTLHYRQDDGNFLAMIGGFAGFFAGGVAGATVFDLADETEAIAAFSVVAASTVAGAVLGGRSQTTMEYRIRKNAAP